MKVNARELRDALRFLKPEKISHWPKGPRNKVLVERTRAGLQLTTDWKDCWFRAVVPSTSEYDCASITPRAAAVVSHSDFAKLIPRGNEDIHVLVSDGLKVRADVECRLADLCDVQGTEEVDQLRADVPIAGRHVDMNLDAFNEVAGAASDDIFRPVLTMVEVTSKTMAATDSYRLYVRYARTKGLKRPVLISAVAARAASGLDRASVRLDKEWFVAFDSHRVVASRFLDAQFPNWKGLVPPGPLAHHVRFDNGIGKVLKNFPADECIVIKPGDKSLTIEEYRRTSKKKKPEMSAEVSGESSIDLVGFNPRFLAQLFEGADNCELAGIDAEHPWKLEEPASDGKRVRLLMPVRIR